MDFILRPLSDFAAAYIDDIIEFSRSSREHKQHLHQVFSRLQKYDLTINPSKAHLGQHKLSFLGHEITSGGVAPLPEKVQAISDYPKSVTIKQLRAFVGLVNYYHSCLKNLVEALAPLTFYLLGYFYTLFVPEGGRICPLSKNCLVSDKSKILCLLKQFFVKFF